jgi:hypothetical protein
MIVGLNWQKEILNIGDNKLCSPICTGWRKEGKKFA